MLAITPEEMRRLEGACADRLEALTVKPLPLFMEMALLLTYISVLV